MSSRGKNVPEIQGGKTVCSYECGEYRAILVKDPESFGAIKYPHALIIYRALDNTSPIMFITAERGTLSPALQEMLPEDFKRGYGKNTENEVFIGVFDDRGHSYFSSSSEYANLEIFESKALIVLKSHLKLACRIHVINDTRRGRMFWSYRLPMYVITVIILAGVLVFLTSVFLYKQSLKPNTLNGFSHPSHATANSGDARQINAIQTKLLNVILNVVDYNEQNLASYTLNRRG